MRKRLNKAESTLLAKGIRHGNEVEDLQIPQKKNLCRKLKGNAKSLCHQERKK